MVIGIQENKFYILNNPEYPIDIWFIEKCNPDSEVKIYSILKNEYLFSNLAYEYWSKSRYEYLEELG